MMNSAPMRHRFQVIATGRLFALGLVLVALVTGCGHYQPGPSQLSPEIATLLWELDNRNSALSSAKGIGNVRLIYKERPQSARLAWAIQAPRKIRMEVMAISGQRLAALSSDGDKLYYLSHGEQRLFKTAYSNASMKALTQVPIRIEDLIALLQGRLPRRDYYSAVLEEREATEGYRLTRVNRWGREMARIFLDSEKRAIQAVEMVNRSGSLDFRVQFNSIRNVAGFQVPYKLEITSQKGERLTIATERYWANASVSEQLFQLEEPR